MFKCASKVVLQFTLLTFAIAHIMCDDDISKADDIAWVMEGRDWKEIIIITSFDYFAQNTCFCLQGFLAKKKCKIHSCLALGAEKVLLMEVQTILSWSSHILNVCSVLPITNQ